MAGRAKENLPGGSLKYLFVYLKVRIFKCSYRLYIPIKEVYLTIKPWYPHSYGPLPVLSVTVIFVHSHRPQVSLAVIASMLSEKVVRPGRDLWLGCGGE